MNVLYVSAEVAPFAKVGGLADVAGSLPVALNALGCDVRVIMPFYGCIDTQKYNIEPVKNSTVAIKVEGKYCKVSLKQATLPNSNVKVYFVENSEYFTSHCEVYPKQAYSRFEQERFVLFSKAVLEILRRIDFKPDIINCNDWHTSHIPVLLKTLYKSDKFYKDIKTVLTIHNLAYQGKYSPDILDFALLDKNEIFQWDKLEFYGDVNWLKGGIVYADYVNTVSKTYAKEIQTQEFGEGLQEVIKANSNKLVGMLNGLDYSQFNPEIDTDIAKNFSYKKLSGKKECKRALLKELNMPIKLTKPLIGIVSRLVDQKGLDFIEKIAYDLQKSNAQYVILGTGQEKYEKMFVQMSKESSNVQAVIGFDAKLAKRIYSGCDMLLMPSRFEPCGLGQIIALKYGTIPIARATGGLYDTIINFGVKYSNGFLFHGYRAEDLLKTINQAIDLYNSNFGFNLFSFSNPWKKLMQTAMQNDFGWSQSAKEYLEMYKKLT